MKNIISNSNYNIMSKNKFTRFMDDLSYFKSVIPEKFKKYFDVVSSLYIERKIEKKSEVEKLLHKLASRGKATASAVKLIETKYKVQEPVIGIKEKIKTYFMTGNVEQIMRFKNKYSKPEGYTKNKLNQVHLQDKVQLIRESEVIKATNIDKARQKFKENIENKFGGGGSESIIKGASNFSPDYYETMVDNIEFLDEVEEGKLSTQDPSTMFLKAASPMDYKFLTCEKKFLNDTGFCVEDNLLGIYSPLIKKFTLKNIVDIASEFYKLKDIDWERSMGYSSECIMHICKKFNISAYAYDIMNQCFSKYISNSRHYPALFYYAMNNHMYLVKDTDQCKSLCEKAKDHKVSFNTSLIEPVEIKNLYDELPIYENLDISTLKGYDLCIVIYSREKLTNINIFYLINLSTN